MSGVGRSGGVGGGGLASWVGFASSSSSSSSPSRRGGRRSSGQVFRNAVGNSRVAHAVRSNKRMAAAGLAMLAVVVLVSSSSAGRRHASYSRSLVADSDNSSELDAATLAELAALNARQGGDGIADSKANSPRKASPTAADLPGTAEASLSATATDLAVKALDRAELAGLVQSTGFFSPDEAEAVVDAVSKGDLDSAELLKAIEEEMAKQEQEEQKLKAEVKVLGGPAVDRSPATQAKAVNSDEVDEWFFDDLDDMGGGDDDDDFFFGDEELEGLEGRRGGRVADDEDGFGDYSDDVDDEFGFGDEGEFSTTTGGGGSRGGRKGGAAAAAGRRSGSARASSSNRRSSSPRRASATVAAPRRGGSNVLNDDFDDLDEGFNTGGGSSSRGGGRGSSSRSRSRLVDLNDDGGDELLENGDDARHFGDVDDDRFDNDFYGLAADGLPPRRGSSSGGGGARQFAEVSFDFLRQSVVVWERKKRAELTSSHRLDFFSVPNRTTLLTTKRPFAAAALASAPAVARLRLRRGSRFRLLTAAATRAAAPLSPTTLTTLPRTASTTLPSSATSSTRATRCLSTRTTTACWTTTIPFSTTRSAVPVPVLSVAAPRKAPPRARRRRQGRRRRRRTTTTTYRGRRKVHSSRSRIFAAAAPRRRWRAPRGPR